jgi:hypothetical protein
VTQLTLAVVAASLLALASSAAAEPRRIEPGVAQEGETLILRNSTGEARVDLDGFAPRPGPARGVVALFRRRDGGSEVRIVDRSGIERGRVEVAPGREALVTDVNVITSPESLHAVGRPHDLAFLDHGGGVRGEGREPELILVSVAAQASGYAATVSRSAASPTAWTVVAYDPNGVITRRFDTAGSAMPEALVTPDGERLVVLERDVFTGTSALTILAPDRQLARHALRNVAALAADAGSRRIAVVGQGMVAVVDARSGRLRWRRDETVDHVLPGGMTFDGRRLNVVAAERDRKTRRARLSLRTYRLADGTPAHGTLGEVPLDALPRVIDVEQHGLGRRRVVLPERALDATLEGTPP